MPLHQQTHTEFRKSLFDFSTALEGHPHKRGNSECIYASLWIKPKGPFWVYMQLSASLLYIFCTVLMCSTRPSALYSLWFLFFSSRPRERPSTENTLPRHKLFFSLFFLNPNPCSLSNPEKPKTPWLNSVIYFSGLRNYRTSCVPIRSPVHPLSPQVFTLPAFLNHALDLSGGSRDPLKLLQD